MNTHFFKMNRDKLTALTPSGLIVLSAYSQMQRGNDASFDFEQEANFWYLTGIEAPDWWVIITKNKSWLVAPDVDLIHQVFDGSLLWNDAQVKSEVDLVISQDQAKLLLRELATKYGTVYTIGPDPQEKGYDFSLNPAQGKLHTYLKKAFNEVGDCRKEVVKLRAIKQPQEITVIKNAIKLTVESFNNLKAKLPALSYEYEVEAEFSYHFRHNGARGHAYDPIIASGKNACTLHYSDNQDKLLKNELLLIDIGARLDGYAADITRTYAYGDVSDRHKAVHLEVETAHHKIIALLEPGLNVKDYFHTVDTIMLIALQNLGLVKEKSDYRKYFPHSISHGLGIDVHDSLGNPDAFQAGMVLTVEPGIYIPEEGIGVRIEDDILITESGHENLSEMLPTSL